MNLRETILAEHSKANAAVVSNCSRQILPMNNWTLEDIKNYGFKGFFKISDLISDH